jgi:autotransporter-associated beta strand protein
MAGRIPNASGVNLTSLVKAGSGTWVISAATNSFTGGTDLQGGTLEIGAGALPATGTVSFTGGAIRWGSGNAADYSNRFSQGAGQQYKLDTGANDVTLATALTSAGGSLQKLGLGTLTLNAVNTFDGPTTISAGTLRLGNNERIADASALVFGGGTLATNGFEEVVSSIGLSESSTLDLGDGASIVAFQDIGSIDTSKTLTIVNWTGSEEGGGTDQVYITDGQNLTGMQLASIQFLDPNGFDPGMYGAAQTEFGEIVPTAVPEPASIGLLSLGMVGLLQRRRRQR